ncbi:hypothetical protein IAT38_007995 [Cryptococcus sp. DSM 104549]
MPLPYLPLKLRQWLSSEKYRQWKRLPEPPQPIDPLSEKEPPAPAGPSCEKEPSPEIYTPIPFRDTIDWTTSAPRHASLPIIDESAHLRAAFWFSRERNWASSPTLPFLHYDRGDGAALEDRPIYFTHVKMGPEMMVS